MAVMTGHTNVAGALSLGLLLLTFPARSETPFGLTARQATRAYLNMPSLAEGRLPDRLSRTGVFADVRQLTVAPGLIPYELVVPFWSDGAQKSRFMAIPSGKIRFSATGEWRFPAGSVFVKTFQMPVDAVHHTLRRLETRLLVVDRAGGVYGAVYKWRGDESDADLLTGSETEDIAVRDQAGESHAQRWYYPSRQDCLTCHTAQAGFVLGVKARQLNRRMTYPNGVQDNELRALDHIRLLQPGLSRGSIKDLPALAALDDPSRSLEDRARSYLDANCSHCHRPGGTVANFDARYSTALDHQALIDGPVLIDEGIDHPRVISPHDIWRSIAYMRINTNDDVRMPPLARMTIDADGVRLMREWIEGLPGRPVLPPPQIRPPGGEFAGTIMVELSDSEPGSHIHYTLDGSVPGPSDPQYTEPLTLNDPAVLRARAYKEGFTRSIAAQQVFIVGKPP
jgi:uncharacterized repeat protein (TIGR03806 family)